MMVTIYEEIKQTRPFQVYGQEAHITILRTADVLQHAVERAIAPFGISHEQYNALRILRGAGASGVPTLEIASRMVSRSPNITRLLDKLIAKKLARRTRSRQDRRVVVITITAEGQALLSRLDRVLDDVFKKFPPTTKTEMQTLLEVLDRIREGMVVKTAKELIREEQTQDAPLHR
jgi:DNA-binding MarR family transcriptional regulator